MFRDIGDYLTRTEKLKIIKDSHSFSVMMNDGLMREIVPNKHGDWLDQRDDAFEALLPLSPEDKSYDILFKELSNGLSTNRDAWALNDSKKELQKNVQAAIDFYNSELQRLKGSSSKPSNDPKSISWSEKLKKRFAAEHALTFSPSKLRISLYRPFNMRWLYDCDDLVERRGKFSEYLPTGKDNRFLLISGKGATTNFSAFMTSMPPSYDLLQKTKAFPLKLFEPVSADEGLFATGEAGYIESAGISNAGLKHFQDAYPDEQINKEDLFYYIYGLLHSPDYRERFKNNLSKELPRIPVVKSAADFWAFTKAGRDLGDLHVGYETVEPYMVTFEEGDHRLIPDVQSNPEAFYRVDKMKLSGKGKNKDKTTVIYNPRITMTNIPERAYDYVVNGKPALEWVMERQCVKTDKASGIVNDANRYAIETVGDPAYPLKLFQRVITVSLKTLDIVESLPPLDID